MTPTHNLPVYLTSFVGREQELADVRRLLAATRLLTLIGAGGVGKTRLALRVAESLVDIYQDGAWAVELAPLGAGALVPQAVAATLAIREAPGQPLIDTLAEALRAKALLLVLYNCEHLVGACADLVECLLRRCPLLREAVALSRAAENDGIEAVSLVALAGLATAQGDFSTARESAEAATSRATAIGRGACARPGAARAGGRVLRAGG